MTPLTADLLCHMKGFHPTGKIGAAFGSSGCSGEAAKLISKVMEEMNIKVESERSE